MTEQPNTPPSTQPTTPQTPTQPPPEEPFVKPPANGEVDAAKRAQVDAFKVATDGDGGYNLIVSPEMTGRLNQAAQKHGFPTFIDLVQVVAARALR